MTRAAPSTIDDTTDLERATATRAALAERIAAGQPVEPAELVAADAAVRLAQLQAVAATDAAARAAEQHRLDRIDALRASLADGSLHEKAAAMLDAHAEAVKALEQVRVLTEQYNAQLGALLRELRQLGELPDGMRVESQPGGRLHAEVDGRRWYVQRDLSDWLVADAAYQAGAQSLAIARTEGVSFIRRDRLPSAQLRRLVEAG